MIIFYVTTPGVELEDDLHPTQEGPKVIIEKIIETISKNMQALFIYDSSMTTSKFRYQGVNMKYKWGCRTLLLPLPWR